MKKRVLSILGLGTLLAAIVGGPALLDLVRLDRFIDASAAAYERERGPWPQVADACTGCHGANGHSVNAQYPSLAGQRPAYLAEQLRRFETGERANPIMNAMARALDQGEAATLAEYFGRQPFGGGATFDPERKLLDEGRRLAASGGCAACHGEGLVGRDAFPRVAGLGVDYLAQQLDAFANGTRRDPSGAMNALASAWSPEDRRAIATFLAREPNPQGEEQ